MATDIPLKAVVVADRLVFATDNLLPSDKRAIDEAIKSSTNFDPSTGNVVQPVHNPKYRFLRTSDEFYLVFEDKPDRINVIDVMNAYLVQKFVPVQPVSAGKPPTARRATRQSSHNRPAKAR